MVNDMNPQPVCDRNQSDIPAENPVPVYGLPAGSTHNCSSLTQQKDSLSTAPLLHERHLPVLLPTSFRIPGYSYGRSA